METATFVFKPSRWLLFFLSVIYGGSALIILLLPLSVLLKIAVIVFISWFFRRAINLHVTRKGKEAIISLSQGINGQWGYETRGGNKGRGRLAWDSFRSSLFVMIRLRSIPKSRSILIPYDALSESEYRTLCTRLTFFN